MKQVRELIVGKSLGARALRSSAWTTLGFGTAQIIRLGSNLILTRLLYPEAFGIMALIVACMVGMNMFSDVGIGPAIVQNKRGDDPEFLNTAWTLGVIRGVLLWLTTFVLAWPLAHFYGEPFLQVLLPVAGLVLLIGGFNPTRIATADRHMLVGRVVVLDILSQLLGVVVMVLLAWWQPSVWALVVGMVAGAFFKLVLSSLFLPGLRNSFQMDRAIVKEIISFGKWIFLSTLCGFVISQGDKFIFGKYITLSALGIYNIGYFLAMFPILLGVGIVRRVMLPLYRDKSPKDSADNFKKLRKARFLLTGFLITPLIAMSLLGVLVVDFLYDDRFLQAGGIVVVMACIQILALITMSYDQAAVAAGDTRRYFYLRAITAASQLIVMIAGIEIAGLFGALVAQGLGQVIVYPVFVWLARVHAVWDPLHDAVYFGLGAACIALALWVNWDAVMMLSSFG